MITGLRKIKIGVINIRIVPAKNFIIMVGQFFGFLVFRAFYCLKCIWVLVISE